MAYQDPARMIELEKLRAVQQDCTNHFCRQRIRHALLPISDLLAAPQVADASAQQSAAAGSSQVQHFDLVQTVQTTVPVVRSSVDVEQACRGARRAHLFTRNVP